MKFLPIVSLALIAPLLLTGCASSPSLEDQAKLIEYEKCLSFAEMIQAKDLALQIEKGDITSNVTIEISLEDCKKYRP